MHRMHKELKPMDITNIPELLRLAEEVQATREARVLTRDGEELVVVHPAKRQKGLKGKPLTEDDPLFSIIGIGRSGVVEGVARNKHKYLADAYRHR